jgi:hypothetical protein
MCPVTVAELNESKSEISPLLEPWPGGSLGYATQISVQRPSRHQPRCSKTSVRKRGNQLPLKADGLHTRRLQD